MAERCKTCHSCQLTKKTKYGMVDTILEIGGQDSKYISIQDGIVIDFAMNEACAAGTGLFLEEQAGKATPKTRSQLSAKAEQLKSLIDAAAVQLRNLDEQETVNNTVETKDKILVS